MKWKEAAPQQGAEEEEVQLFMATSTLSGCVRIKYQFYMLSGPSASLSLHLTILAAQLVYPSKHLLYTKWSLHSSLLQQHVFILMT